MPCALHIIFLFDIQRSVANVAKHAKDGDRQDRDVLSRTDSISMHPNRIRHTRGVNILHTACESKNTKCVEFLINEIMKAR